MRRITCKEDAGPLSSDRPYGPQAGTSNSRDPRDMAARNSLDADSCLPRALGRHHLKKRGSGRSSDKGRWNLLCEGPYSQSVWSEFLDVDIGMNAASVPRVSPVAGPIRALSDRAVTAIAANKNSAVTNSRWRDGPVLRHFRRHSSNAVPNHLTT